MEQSLTTREPKASLLSWREMQEQAKVLIKSGFLPPQLRTPEQVMSVVATGRELGLGMMQSIRSIDIIQNRPAIKPRLMLALAFEKGLIQDVRFSTSETEAVFTVHRKGMSSSHTEKFTMAKAKRMNLTMKDNWIKQPDTMLLWRAISAAMNLVFPDVLYGLQTPDEVGAAVVVDSNDPLEGRIVDQAPVPKAPPIAAPVVINPPEEAIHAKEEQKESQEAVPQKENKKEVSDDRPIDEIRIEAEQRLMELAGGDIDAADLILKKITKYKSKKDGGEEKWLSLKDLENIAQHRPAWIKGVHKKVSEAWEREIQGGKGNE